MSYRTIIVLAAGAALSSATLLTLASSPRDIAQHGATAQSDSRAQGLSPGVQIITRADALRMGLQIPPPPTAPPSFADQLERAHPVASNSAETGLFTQFPDAVLPAGQVLDAETEVGGTSTRDEGGEYFHSIEPAPDFPGEAPPVESECDADFDQSGQVTVGDMLGYVHAWFGEAELEPERLDYNDSGAAEIDDLMMFLNIWFTGC